MTDYAAMYEQLIKILNTESKNETDCDSLSMARTIRKMLGELVDLRINCAFERLTENSKYTMLCEKQDSLMIELDKLYQHFSEDERDIIWRYNEGETNKSIYENEEIYLQGLRDGLKILQHGMSI